MLHNLQLSTEACVLRGIFQNLKNRDVFLELHGRTPACLKNTPKNTGRSRKAPRVKRIFTPFIIKIYENQ